MADDDEAQVITPPSQLRDRISTGGLNAVDMASIERAEQAISDMSASYLDWVVEDLEKLQGTFDRLLAGEGDRAKDMKKIFEVAHDMKGQGGSFDYQLITSVGNLLCRALERFDGSVKPEVENQAIRIHIDAMKLIIANKMSGDGGKEGEAIIHGIQQVAEKLIPSK